MVFFLFIKNLIEHSEQTVDTLIRCCRISDLGLYSLPMSNKNDARLIWVKMVLRWICLYFTSQSTIFQQCQDVSKDEPVSAAHEHNTVPHERLEPATPLS